MSELLNHIRELNAGITAWVAEDPQNRWAGLLVEDLAHWAEYDVHTVEDFHRYMAVVTYSDAYKEAFGMRPPAGSIDGKSVDELYEEVTWFGEFIARDEEHRREYEQWIQTQNEEYDRVRPLFESEPLPYDEYDR